MDNQINKGSPDHLENFIAVIAFPELQHWLNTHMPGLRFKTPAVDTNSNSYIFHITSTSIQLKYYLQGLPAVGANLAGCAREDTYLAHRSHGLSEFGSKMSTIVGVNLAASSAVIQHALVGRK